RIMKVAVPWPKHSWMLGQLASSHTVTSRLLRSLALSAATAPVDGIRTRIQDGLRSTGASTNSTGERAILSPPSCLAPVSSDAGASAGTICSGIGRDRDWDMALRGLATGSVGGRRGPAAAHAPAPVRTAVPTRPAARA